MLVKSNPITTAINVYGSINACQDISVNVNMAEGPSTTTTPSNQFVVKYIVAQPSCVQAHMESLHW